LYEYQQYKEVSWHKYEYLIQKQRMSNVPTILLIGEPKRLVLWHVLSYENREIMANTLPRRKAGMDGHVQLLNRIVSNKEAQ